jgi:hypothetical protein
MVRYMAGAGSVLFLAVAAFFLWKSHSQAEQLVPAAPAPAAEADRGPPNPPPAAPERTREERRFARYDADENGAITRAEMMDTRRKPFAKLDTNGDGRLSFEEWAIATAEKFDKADADHSGILTRAEFATTKRETKARKCEC